MAGCYSAITLLLKFQSLFLELEIVLCVVVADVFDHLVDTLLLVACIRYLTVLDVVSEYVAENAAEVLVSRIRKEGARVGKHTYESTQQAKE